MRLMLLVGFAAFLSLELPARCADTFELPADGRIVFCGDSITGQGVGGGGWIQLIGKALQAADPQAKPKLVCLGGSGQGVGSWLRAEKKSRDQEVRLDDKRFDAHVELALPADVLVIMLGMNDVLAPYIGESDADVERWATDYRTLITALRERVTPKLTVLGTITPCTEDPFSPKNRLIAKMNTRLAVLATEMDCVLAPTGEVSLDYLNRGREFKPDFRITRDFVHPKNYVAGKEGAGHLAIADGMLQGMGLAKAGGYVAGLKESLWRDLAKETPAISWRVRLLEDEAKLPACRFAVSYTWRGADATKPVVRLVVPAGWTCEPQQRDAPAGEFTVTASEFALRNTCRFEVVAGAETVKKECVIPAPWQACVVGKIGLWGKIPIQSSAPTEPPKGPLDDAIVAGEDVFAAGAALNRPLVWKLFLPGPDYSGYDDPGSLDFAGVHHAGMWEAGYGLRHLTSTKERTAILKLGATIFAGTIGLDVWLNGEKVYAGVITQAPGKKAEVPVKLREGSNVLAFKSSHGTWQWQQNVSLEPVEGDDLDDLRIQLAPTSN